MRRVLIGLAVLFAIPGVIYVGMLTTLWLSPGKVVNCSVYPVMDVASPKGTYAAVMENRRCEGEQGGRWITVVWMIDGKSVNVGGRKYSVFMAPLAQDAPERGAYQPLRLWLAWLSDHELQISYPKGIELLSSASPNFQEGVKVTYQEQPR